MKPISKYYNSTSIPPKFLKIDNSIFQEFISKEFIKSLMVRFSDKPIYYVFSNQAPDKIFFRDNVQKGNFFLKFAFLNDNLSQTKKKIMDLKEGFINLGIDISSVQGKAKHIGNYLTIYFYNETKKIVITYGNLNLNLYSFSIAEDKPIYTFSISDENSIKIKCFGRWTSLTMNTFFSLLRNEEVGTNSYHIIKELMLNFFKLNNNNEYFVREFEFGNIHSSLILPKIPLKEFRKISNKKKLLKRIFAVDTLPNEFLKFNFNEISYFNKNLKIVSFNDWQKIISFYLISKKNNDFPRYENPLDFEFQLLVLYYQSIFTKNGSVLESNASQAKILIRDYINLCKILSMNVNLKMTSFKKLKLEHDRLALELIERDTEKRAIRIKEEYKKINFISLIETTDELVLESKRQHHCVASYLNSIENGFCAIYTDIFESKRYTIEISYNSISQIYILRQCKGVFNTDAPANYLQALRMNLKIMNNPLVIEK